MEAAISSSRSRRQQKEGVEEERRRMYLLHERGDPVSGEYGVEE